MDILFVLIPLSVVLALFFAQSPQTTPTFLETLDVRITNVDVVVTDRAGKPVLNLGREDFVILENGAPQTITNFAEYGGTSGTAEAMGQPNAPAAPAPPPAAPPRKFLFYIDEMSLTGRTEPQLADAAAALIRRELRPGDEAMVMTHANRTQVALDFTGDAKVVEKRLREALHHLTSFRADTARQEIAYWFSEVEFFLRHGPPASSVSEQVQKARIYATRVNRRVTSTLRSLLGLVGALNQTSGRKILVVLTESLPAEPGKEAFGVQTLQAALSPIQIGISGAIAEDMESKAFDPGDAAAHASWFDVRPMIRELGARASANGVTIYTLQPDLGGVVQVPGAGADAGGRRSIGGSQGSGGFAVNQFGRQILEETRETLQTLADDTGGKYFLGGSQIENGFRTIAEDVTAYYSLGYRSAAAGESGVQKIDVRVKGRPELVVRARREILRRSPQREMDEIVAANLVYPRAVNELAITASAGTPENRIQNVRVPVIVKIPMSKLTFIPNGDKYRAEFSVHYAAADGAGFTTGASREQTVDVPAAEIDAARTKVFTYTSYLSVARGTLNVAVGVYDKYSRLAGFQQLEVDAR